MDLVQPTPLAGVELRGAADFPDDSYTILLMHYGTVEGHWKLLKDKYGKTVVSFSLATCICLITLHWERESPVDPSRSSFSLLFNIVFVF